MKYLKINYCFMFLISVMLESMMAMTVCAQEKEPEDTIALFAASNKEPTFRVSIPTSPQALAFQRVGEFDVNNSSGIPDINIPLFEIDHFGYKIPFSLRYEAIPLRPGYHYDVFGYGWTLQGSSCVSRTINSQPDECCNFELSKDFMNNYIGNAASSMNSANWEYDNFNVILPDGSSFDFIIQNAGNGKYRCVVSNGRAVKVTFDKNLTAFVIVDEEGVKYTFDVRDHFQVGRHTVAWNLGRIDLPYTNIPIIYTYGITFKTPYGQGVDTPYLYLYHKHKYSNGEGDLSDDTVCKDGKTAFSSNSYTMKLLTNVTYGVTDIALEYTSSSLLQGYNHLRKITIKDHSSVKKHFDMSYKINSVMSAQDTVAMLKDVSMYGADVEQIPMRYTFQYGNVSGMNGTDYWGNLTHTAVDFSIANMNVFVENYIKWLPKNGSPAFRIKEKGESESGIPYTKICLQADDHVLDHRKPLDPYFHGVLREITYPTGGKTELEYENHGFITAHDSDGKFIHVKKKRSIYQGGGFRIRKITNYTVDGKVADVKSYRYGPTYRQINDENMNLPSRQYRLDVHCGYGEPTVDPNVLTFSSFTAFQELSDIPYMFTGLSSEGKQESFYDPFSIYDPYMADLDGVYWLWECTFSSLNFQSLLNGRKAVSYPYITVYDGDVGYDEENIEQTTGKTTYKYYIYDDERYQDSVCFESPRYFGKVLASEERKYKWNQLLEKSEYEMVDGVFRLKQKDAYRYNELGCYVEGYLDAKMQPLDRYNPQERIWNLMAEHGNYYGYSLPGSIAHETYLPNGKLTLWETYGYNANLVQCKVEKGEKVSETQYPLEQNVTVPMEQKLIEQNMLKTPLRTVVSEYGDESSGEKIEYQEYQLDGKSVILPSKISSLYVSPMRENSSYVPMDSVVSYTHHGHLREVVGKDGIHIVYLWGYDNRYLIAEIVNATLDEVEEAIRSLVGVDIESLESASALDDKRWRLLGQQTALSKAMVTSYTYSPLVGITSQTRPSGLSTFYKYDGWGRLVEIYDYRDNVISDANRRVLKQYDYHYFKNSKE